MIKINKRFYYPTSTRKIIDGKRHYLVGEEKLPSVTSILKACESKDKSDSLQRWRDRVGEAEAKKITETAASRGTEPCRWYTGRKTSTVRSSCQARPQPAGADTSVQAARN